MKSRLRKLNANGMTTYNSGFDFNPKYDVDMKILNMQPHVDKSIIDSIHVPAMMASSPMIPLNKLDSADVRFDRCPMCGNNGLESIEGFLICPRCGTNYKHFDGQVYICDDKPGHAYDMILKNIGLHRMYD